MMYVSNNNLKAAKKQAQANADRSGQAWIVFLDTASNLRVEKLCAFGEEATAVKDSIFIARPAMDE
jgi:hypothetical protein